MRFDRYTPARAAWSTARRLGLSGTLLRLGLRFVLSPARARAAFGTYEPSARDVVVATFMKSGTNWMLQIALQIAWRGRAEFEHVHDLVAWPDSPDPRVVVPLDVDVWSEAPTGMRVIKTHNPAAAVPLNDDARYITVLRDPKEVLVSSYYFGGALLDVLDALTPQDWLRITMASPDGHHAWLDHSVGWWALRDRPNVLVLTYAEMKRDLPGAVDRIAAHMGVALTPAERDAVIQRSGLAWMKAHKTQFRPVKLPFVEPRTMPDMIRRGAAGGADELYTDEELSTLEAVILERIDSQGLDFPYAELFTSR